MAVTKAVEVTVVEEVVSQEVEKLPGKYVLVLLLVSLLFSELGRASVIYTVPDEVKRLRLPKEDVLGNLKFAIGEAPTIFSINTSNNIFHFLSSFIWPYHIFFGHIGLFLGTRLTYTHEWLEHTHYSFDGVSLIIAYGYWFIPLAFPGEPKHTIEYYALALTPLVYLSPVVGVSFLNEIEILSLVDLVGTERIVSFYMELPHAPFEATSIIFTVVATHLITYAGFRTIYFSLKTLLRRMSLSDLKREVKKRYLLALRESKYLISWAIFLLVIAALLEGLAPIYNYLGLKYYPWAVIAGYLSYLSITLWIIYLYYKKMRFSTPWEEIRRLLRAKRNVQVTRAHETLKHQVSKTSDSS